MEKYLPLLLELAKKSFDNEDIPVSCIILRNDEIISTGFNTRHNLKTVVGHAEINAIIAAEKKINDFRLNGFVMVTTLQPCSMCYEVIESSRIDKVYYLLEQKSKKNYPHGKYEQIYFPGNIYFEKYCELFHSFFKKIR